MMINNYLPIVSLTIMLVVVLRARAHLKMGMSHRVVRFAGFAWLVAATLILSLAEGFGGPAGTILGAVAGCVLGMRKGASVGTGLVLFSLVALVTSTQPAWAQESTTVIVRDGGTEGIGIAGAKVEIDGPVKRTDTDGAVTFRGLESGEYSIRVTAEGFAPSEVEAKIPDTIVIGMGSTVSSDTVIVGSSPPCGESACDCSELYELKHALLDHRADTISKLIDAAAVYLALIAAIVGLTAYIGYQRVHEIEQSARAILQNIKGLEEEAEAIVLGTVEVRKTDLRRLVGGMLLLIVALSSNPIDLVFTANESSSWELLIRLLLLVPAAILILPGVINRNRGA